MRDILRRTAIAGIPHEDTGSYRSDMLYSCPTPARERPADHLAVLNLDDVFGMGHTCPIQLAR
jgi:hypothetical protein